MRSSLKRCQSVFPLALLFSVLAAAAPVQAQSRTFHVDGRVTGASFSPCFQQPPVKVGDRLAGSVTYHSGDPFFPNGWISGSYRVGNAQFGGLYDSVTPGAPRSFEADSDFFNFGGDATDGTGSFPDALSHLSVVNGKGSFSFFGLAYANGADPNDPNCSANPDGFSVDGSLTLTAVPEPGSLGLFASGLMALGLGLRRRRHAPGAPSDHCPAPET
jgi:hypothetical protein